MATFLEKGMTLKPKEFILVIGNMKNKKVVNPFHFVTNLDNIQYTLAPFFDSEDCIEKCRNSIEDQVNARETMENETNSSILDILTVLTHGRGNINVRLASMVKEKEL